MVKESLKAKYEAIYANVRKVTLESFLILAIEDQMIKNRKYFEIGDLMENLPWLEEKNLNKPAQSETYIFLGKLAGMRCTKDETGGTPPVSDFTVMHIKSGELFHLKYKSPNEINYFVNLNKERREDVK